MSHTADANFLSGVARTGPAHNALQPSKTIGTSAHPRPGATTPGNNIANSNLLARPFCLDPVVLWSIGPMQPDEQHKITACSMEMAAQELHSLSAPCLSSLQHISSSRLQWTRSSPSHLPSRPRSRRRFRWTTRTPAAAPAPRSTASSPEAPGFEASHHSTSDTMLTSQARHRRTFRSRALPSPVLSIHDWFKLSFSHDSPGGEIRGGRSRDAVGTGGQPREGRASRVLLRICPGAIW